MAAYQVHLTPKSNNSKTGPIPVSTTTAGTCPTACPFRSDAAGGCYAASGPLALHWRAVTNGERGTDWSTFVQSIAALPDGQLWRHNQAGDLPGDGQTIDASALAQLVDANRKKRGFTYTHYTPTGANGDAIRAANAGGFVVNLSANDPAHADTLARAAIGPVVTVLAVADGRAKGESLDAYRERMPTRTPEGRRLVVCPATYLDDVSCATCQLCARGDRTSIVGFPAHGTGAKRADSVARRSIPIRAA